MVNGKGVGICMNELEELARKYGTDKREPDDNEFSQCHGYTEKYHELFQDWATDQVKLLEIGIWEGGSHKMWKEYFPNGEIHGIDNFFGLYNKLHQEKPDIAEDEAVNNINQKISELSNFGIHVHTMDQMNKDRLKEDFQDNYFDIIIDDGGHASWQHQTSLSVLWLKLNSGGYYIIEDLDTCKEREFRQYDDIRSSTLWFLDNLADMKDVPFSYYISTVDLIKMQSEIDYIEIDGQLGIIKKL